MKIRALVLALACASVSMTSARAGIFDHIVASNTDRLKLATSDALGGQTSYQEVEIVETHRGMTTVKWRAKTPTGTYTCMDDDMMRGRASCAKEPDETDKQAVAGK